MNKKTEILSPAGSMPAFIAAINAGADAIYMGVEKYNARAMTTNFSMDEYINCIFEAHKRDVKIYLTLNTLLKNDEIKEALKIVAKLYSKGLDAVIVQDLGLALKIHELFPDLALHASTQMSVYSIEQVNYLEKLGFTRVVLARELSVDEIADIAKQSTVELEVFVHGALCVGVSGQCNMSKLIGDRSANRGSCAQPCRMKYSLYNSNNKGLVLNKYLLSKKDIWGLEYVQKLKEIGITSLKIEGRNKFPEYVYKATSVYKKALNEEVTNVDKKELLQLFNRSGKCEGYFNGRLFRESITENTPKNVGLKLGQVLDRYKNYVKVKLEENIDMQDGIEIYSKDIVSTIVTCIKDESKNIINKEVQAGNIVWLGDINDKCNIGDTIYKTSSSSLNKRIYSEFVTKLKKQKEYSINIQIKKDKNVYINIKGNEFSLDYLSDIVPEVAQKRGLLKADIINAFSKTEETSVKFSKVETDLDEGLFLPISKLNDIRRGVIQKIEDRYKTERSVSKTEKKIDELSLENTLNDLKTKKESLYIYKYNPTRDYVAEYFKKYNVRLEKLYITATDFALYEQDIFDKYNNLELCFVIPNVTLKRQKQYINTNLEKLIKKGIKDILIGHLGFLEYVKKLKKQYELTIGADYSLNITNILTAKHLQNEGIDYVTLSFELNDEETLILAKQCNAEVVENLACAMTSRYCMIGSYVGTQKNKICDRACMKDTYYIMDTFGKRYDIVCDNLDCIMRLIRNKDRYSDEVKKTCSVRHVWL